MRGINSLLVAVSLIAIAAPAAAQTAGRNVGQTSPTRAAAPAVEPAASSDDIIVTAVARGQNRLDSSVSVSTLNASDIAAASPRSLAELFRSLPGIRSESSGGEGNANIQSRGIPISTGGAKFLQLQEDGLPIVEYGDISFGNADIFLRADFNVARVESVRGGSASTFASNSPGGVINLISKTGEQEGGAIQATTGLDYREYRLDADYGGRLSDSLTFHVGGFYRAGEGPRRIGYDGNKGGQIKGSITKTFGGNGYFRLNFKYLDDRAIAYAPSPVRVTGSNGNPTYSAITNFRPQNDAIQSINFVRAVTLDGANNREVDDVRDGMHPIVKAVGFETGFDVADGWTVTNRFRYSDISGRFLATFPASVDSAQNQANAVSALNPANGTGAGSTLFYATGPLAGQQVTNPSALNGNGLAMGIVLFNTRLRSLNNVTNDLRISHSFDIGGSKLDLTAGFYKSRQTIDIDWLWTSVLESVGGGGSAVLLDVRNAAGVLQTENGVVGYGATFFGGCCRRSYNVDYDTNAPFASLSFQTDRLTIDGSLRYDFGRANGFTAGDGPTTTFDVLGNGSISVPDTRTTIIPATTQPVNYSYNYLSYSVGANYRIGDGLAVFARYSRGGRTNADRFLFGSNLTAGGDLAPGARPVDFVRQAEAGLKYQGGGLSLYGTAFWARTQEQNYEATTQRSFNNTYRAYGLELEGVYRTGGFSIAASGTYTDAKIVGSQTAANIGNRPRRQAEFIYKVTPSYTGGIFTVGASAIGTTSSYAQDSNQLKLPGFTTVNAFVSVRPIERVTVSVNANNLFNVAGYTEAEEGSISGNGIVRARSINGRTIAASVKFDF
jgi:outer membrane receptor protein involved in Fe transport